MAGSRRSGKSTLKKMRAEFNALGPRTEKVRPNRTLATRPRQASSASPESPFTPLEPSGGVIMPVGRYFLNLGAGLDLVFFEGGSDTGFQLLAGLTFPLGSR